MPPVQAVLVGPNALTVLQLKDASGTVSLALSAIPTGTLVTAADYETWIDNWLATNITAGYQAVCHVITISPLRIQLWVTDAGLTIPANWWTLPN